MAAWKRDLPSVPNHDIEIYTIVAVFCTLSLLALILRFAARKIKRIKLGYEDYFVIVAWLIAVGEAIAVASGPQNSGLGRHASTLTEDQTKSFGLGDYALPLLQTSSLGFAKLSVLIQLHRIFITPRFQLTMYILGTIVIAWWISNMFAYALICIPVRSIWEPDIPHHCVNQKALNLSEPIPWILTDFAILFAPIPMIKGLQLSSAKKAGVIALFMTGCLTCVVACVRYSKLNELTDDLPWSSTGPAVWSVIELHITVICACVIVIKPAIKHLLPEALITFAKEHMSRFFSSLSRGSGSTSRSRRTTYEMGSWVHMPNDSPHLRHGNNADFPQRSKRPSVFSLGFKKGGSSV